MHYTQRLATLFVAGLALLAIAGCSSKEKKDMVFQFNMEAGLSPTQEQKAEAGIISMSKTCPGLAAYFGDWSQGGLVTVGEPLYGDREEKGWEQSVYVELVIADHPRKIPASFRAWGHHCHFSINPDGPQPGVSLAKAACASLCAGEPSDQTFFPATQ